MPHHHAIRSRLICGLRRALRMLRQLSNGNPNGVSRAQWSSLRCVSEQHGSNSFANFSLHQHFLIPAAPGAPTNIASSGLQTCILRPTLTSSLTRFPAPFQTSSTTAGSRPGSPTSPSRSTRARTRATREPSCLLLTGCRCRIRPCGTPAATRAAWVSGERVVGEGERVGETEERTEKEGEDGDRDWDRMKTTALMMLIVQSKEECIYV